MRISGIDYAAVTTTRPAETAPSLGEVLGHVRPRRAWPFSSYRLYVGDEEVAHGVEADPGAASVPRPAALIAPPCGCPLSTPQ